MSDGGVITVDVVASVILVVLWALFLGLLSALAMQAIRRHPLPGALCLDIAACVVAPFTCLREMVRRRAQLHRAEIMARELLAENEAHVVAAVERHVNEVFRMHQAPSPPTIPNVYTAAENPDGSVAVACKL